MTWTMDLFIPNKKRSELGRFLTKYKGLRAEAVKPPPNNPRTKEHAQPVPSIRTPNEYRGAYLERYEEPCGCISCKDKRIEDADIGSFYAPVYTQVLPGELPFEEVYQNALEFPKQYRTAPEQWLRSTEDDFEETEHPRGQPENAGEFAKKAGGTAKLSPSRALVPALPDRSDLPEHIKRLVLPPAWKNVHYHPDPAADLLAIGTDEAGRKQYVYSEKFAKAQSVIKFARVRALQDKFNSIAKHNEANRTSSIPAVRDLADVTKLIMQTGIRPGSDTDTKSKVKAYGATTLQGIHVIQDASGVSLKFTGKKGVALTIPVTDPSTVQMLRGRANTAGKEGALFPAANDKTLQGYIKQLSKGEAKPKDIRTYVANNTAMKVMGALPTPANETQYKKAVHEVAKKVSVVLGNTPTVALASYINPEIFATWRAGLELQQ